MDRETGTFYCPVLGVAPMGYEDERQAEKDELDRERIRLWYVAATRARELLLLPRLDVAPQKGAWIGLVDLLPPDLPAFDATAFPAAAVGPATGVTNGQTREVFAQEAAGIVQLQTHLKWLAPSRDEDAAGPVMIVEEAEVWTDGEEASPPVLDTRAPVQGGRERGLILHKLMEEVLTGELREEPEQLTARAGELVRLLGRIPAGDAAVGLSPDELGGCVTRTLAIAEIAALRAGLLPEFPVYALRQEEAGLVATAGVADALTTDGDGRPVIIVDWKSDVAPEGPTIEHYHVQVRAYLDMTGAKRGMIVMMTTGQVVEVAATPLGSAC